MSYQQKNNILNDANTTVDFIEVVEYESCDQCGIVDTTCLRISISASKGLSDGTRKETFVLCPKCLNDFPIELIVNYLYDYMAEIRLKWRYEENVIKYRNMRLCPYHFIKTLQVLDVQSVRPEEIAHTFAPGCDMCILDAAYIDVLEGQNKKNKGFTKTILKKVAKHVVNEQVFNVWKKVKKEVEDETI